MIKRVAPKKYVVMSPDGKKTLSKPISHSAAVKRVETTKSTGGY